MNEDKDVTTNAVSISFLIIAHHHKYLSPLSYSSSQHESSNSKKSPLKQQH